MYHNFVMIISFSLAMVETTGSTFPMTTSSITAEDASNLPLIGSSSLSILGDRILRDNAAKVTHTFYTKLNASLFVQSQDNNTESSPTTPIHVLPKEGQVTTPSMMENSATIPFPVKQDDTVVIFGNVNNYNSSTPPFPPQKPETRGMKIENGPGNEDIKEETHNITRENATDVDFSEDMLGILERSHLQDRTADRQITGNDESYDSMNCIYTDNSPSPWNAATGSAQRTNKERPNIKCYQKMRSTNRMGEVDIISKNVDTFGETLEDDIYPSREADISILKPPEDDYFYLSSSTLQDLWKNHINAEELHPIDIVETTASDLLEYYLPPADPEFVVPSTTSEIDEKPGTLNADLHHPSHQETYNTQDSLTLSPLQSITEQSSNIAQVLPRPPLSTSYQESAENVPFLPSHTFPPDTTSSDSNSHLPNNDHNSNKVPASQLFPQSHQPSQLDSHISKYSELDRVIGEILPQFGAHSPAGIPTHILRDVLSAKLPELISHDHRTQEDIALQPSDSSDRTNVVSTGGDETEGSHSVGGNSREGMNNRIGHVEVSSSNIHSLHLPQDTGFSYIETSRPGQANSPGVIVTPHSERTIPNLGSHQFTISTAQDQEHSEDTKILIRLNPSSDTKQDDRHSISATESDVQNYSDIDLDNGQKIRIRIEKKPAVTSPNGPLVNHPYERPYLQSPSHQPLSPTYQDGNQYQSNINDQFPLQNHDYQNWNIPHQNHEIQNVKTPNIPNLHNRAQNQPSTNDQHPHSRFQNIPAQSLPVRNIQGQKNAPFKRKTPSQNGPTRHPRPTPIPITVLSHGSPHITMLPDVNSDRFGGALLSGIEDAIMEVKGELANFFHNGNVFNKNNVNGANNNHGGGSSIGYGGGRPNKVSSGNLRDKGSFADIFSKGNIESLFSEGPLGNILNTNILRDIQNKGEALGNIFDSDGLKTMMNSLSKSDLGNFINNFNRADMSNLPGTVSNSVSQVKQKLDTIVGPLQSKVGTSYDSAISFLQMFFTQVIPRDYYDKILSVLAIIAFLAFVHVRVSLMISSLSPSVTFSFLRKANDFISTLKESDQVQVMIELATEVYQSIEKWTEAQLGLPSSLTAHLPSSDSVSDLFFGSEKKETVDLDTDILLKRNSLYPPTDNSAQLLHDPSRESSQNPYDKKETVDLDTNVLLKRTSLYPSTNNSAQLLHDPSRDSSQDPHDSVWNSSQVSDTGEASGTNNLTAELLTDLEEGARLSAALVDLIWHYGGERSSASGASCLQRPICLLNTAGDQYGGFTGLLFPIISTSVSWLSRPPHDVFTVLDTFRPLWLSGAHANTETCANISPC